MQTAGTLYINDLPDSVKSEVEMFADDTKIFDKTSNSNTIQADLDALSEWSKKWLLKFNEGKCKALHFGKKNANQDYYLNGQKIDSSDCEKDLGVLVSNDAKSAKQCAAAAKKANSCLYVLKKTDVAEWFISVCNHN